MTMPEWAAIILVTMIVGVISWGVKRLVKANDDTSTALTGINQSLYEMNTRLGQSETWMEQHEKQDDERHQETKQSHRAMWEAIEGLRDQRA